MINSTLQANEDNKPDFVSVNIRAVNNGYIVTQGSNWYPEPQWVFHTLQEAKDKAIELTNGADL